MCKYFKNMEQIRALIDAGAVVLVVASLGAGAVLVASAIAAMRRRRRGLITTGPYAITRNPTYVGLAFLYLGVALSLRLVWAIVLLPLAILVVDKLVVAREERYLTERFGDEYRHYVATTRRWLLARWRAS